MPDTKVEQEFEFQEPLDQMAWTYWYKNVLKVYYDYHKAGLAGIPIVKISMEQPLSVECL